MPETARILQFPASQGQVARSSEMAQSIAHDYLEQHMADRSEAFVFDCLSGPDTLQAICTILKALRNVAPFTAVEESSRIYVWLAASNHVVGVFDERNYFLGETAFLAGSACRLLGRREDAELWLERAEAGFRDTINSAPLLANIAYERIALHYDTRRYDRVLELLPSLVVSFQRLNMKHELLKCRFLEATSLKDAARRNEALERLERLRSDPLLRDDPMLHGLVLANLGELFSGVGRYGDAICVYRQALALQSGSSQPLAGAHLKVAIAESLRGQGQLDAAIEYYRGARRAYAAVGILTMVAYIRVLTAEMLIISGRPREAEWEILAALPTIKEQRMVPEGFAAVVLLRESVRLRKTDRSALRRLREHLQTTEQVEISASREQ